MKGARIGVAVGVVAVLAGAGFAARNLAGSTAGVLGEDASVVPLTTISRGSLELTVHMRGELRPVRQEALAVPSVGGVLRISELLETGARVASGDKIVEFDPSDQEYALEQAESQLQEAEQEILKRRADIEAQQAQQAVTLLTAEFDVRRAELDARVNADLIGANEYRIRQVTLEESRRRLVQVKQDADASAVTTQASLQVLNEKLTRQRMAADQARQNMDNLALHSTIAGIVSVRDNRDASGGFMFSGMTLPPYRAGDDARSGRPIVDVLDVSTMEILAKVNEQERANVKVGQRARVVCDAAPGAEYDAVVTAVAGLASRQDYSQGPLRVFDVRLEIAAPDDQLRPGASVDVLMLGETLDDLLVLPRQAVFEANGKPIVYVPSPTERGSFEAREVTVLHRSETMVALEGVPEGTSVALVDPASVRATISERPAAASPAGIGK